MKLEYLGLKDVSGNIIVLDKVEQVSFDEVVEISLDNGERRLGRVEEIFEDKAIIQVFEGTSGMSAVNTRARLTGEPLKLALSREMLGRSFNGIGKPIDGLGDLPATEKRDVNGSAINPTARMYPRNFIQTGISAIDALTTLIRGQKLPVFSGNGLPHDKLAVQIVNQAKVTSDGDSGDDFAIVFGAMGVKNDVARYFRKSFEESGVLEKVVMFTNLANDPVVERIVTPRCALTCAEYLAFDLGMHVLVILTDMTTYCEALREVSSSKGEIPSRKGFPGYMYSDLASLYERAGMLKDRAGSITQVPILTMPNDDITHPVADLTGYITEGQVVLSRELNQKSIYPPITVLPSLSRLMKDGIGEGYTRADHPQVANQLFACYSKVQDVKALASVIGEDELSDTDKLYMEFGKGFEGEFLSQKFYEDRTIEETLNIGWRLLKKLPREELTRIEDAVLDEYLKKDL